MSPFAQLMYEINLVRMRYFLNFIILILVSDFSTDLTNADCRNVFCPTGRECRKVSGREDLQCACIRRCPKKSLRRRKRICGSDGFPYGSMCHLYRHACRTGREIVPLLEDTKCLKNTLTQLKKLIRAAEEELLLKEEPLTPRKSKPDNPIIENGDSPIQVPVACNQNERNRMRESIINFISSQASQKIWFEKEMSYRRILSESFSEMDSDNDTNVDSFELFNYVNYKTQKKRATPTSQNDIIIELELQEDVSTLENRIDERKLCIDALVEEGDTNKDWRLSKKELMLLMNKHYKPSDKYCIKDRKMYEDSTTIRVDCNGCVCACGKWICTARPCSTESPEAYKTTEKLDEFSYDDMDNQIE